MCQMNGIQIQLIFQDFIGGFYGFFQHFNRNYIWVDLSNVTLRFCQIHNLLILLNKFFQEGSRK